MSNNNGFSMQIMRVIEHIRQKIETEVFNYTQLTDLLREYSKPRDAISSLTQKGDIVRIRKGLYVFGTPWRRKPVSREMLANLVFGPSVVSLDFALSWYGLIPERVTNLTSTTPERSRHFDTPTGRFSYQHLSHQRFAYGVSIQKNDSGNWMIAEPLKAIADKVWLDKRFSPSSPSSYGDYLFEDIRIDESALEGYINPQKIIELESVFSARKVTWLVKFLQRRYF